MSVQLYYPLPPTMGLIKNDFFNLSTCLYITETGRETASELMPLEQIIGLKFERSLHEQREHCIGCANGPRTEGTSVRVNEVGKRVMACPSSDVSIDPTAAMRTRLS